jgi:hypothetical protein
MKNHRNPTKQTQGKEKAPSASTLEGFKGVRSEQLNSSSKPEKSKKNRIVRKWHESSTAAQYAKIIELLSPCGKTVHTYQFRNNGIGHPSARIKELNEIKGIPILNVMEADVYDAFGYFHPRVAFYQMKCPDDKDAPQ